MKTIITLASAAAWLATATYTDAQNNTVSMTDPQFEAHVVATAAEPWEILWGPDNYLWVTEKEANRITRIHPADGSKQVVLEIPEVVRMEQGSHDGMLGMAFHPDLLKGFGTDFVYVSFTYNAAYAGVTPGTVTPRIKLRRYSYNLLTHTLGSPVDLITNLPSSTDHDGGRLVFGPDNKLYYTIGDQGANQLAHYAEPNHAQDLPSQYEVRGGDWYAYKGKVLRLNLDGSVPSDNPVINGVRSHVFSYGHRNPQGLVFGRKGKLYNAEQGPKSDDEINLIQAGKNYGWPYVAGYQDDKAYVYGNWSASKNPGPEKLTYSDAAIPPSVPKMKESDWHHPDFTPPLSTFYTVETGHDFFPKEYANDPKVYQLWPTIAPSSVTYYDDAEGKGIPGWDNSLLVTSLKDGTVFRVKLSDDGNTVVGNPVPQFKTVNRYRAIALSPDKKTIYITTAPSNPTRDRAGKPTSVLENPGAIIAIQYKGK